MAELVFPSDQVVDWTANTHTGVIGGIPTGYTKHGATIEVDSGDQRAEIQSALDSASPGEYVLLGAGTFECAGTLTIPTGVILRGSGMLETIISITSGIKGIFCGSESNYNIGSTSGDSVTIGNTRGSDTITISSTASYSVGDMIFLQASDTLDPSLPIVSTTGQVNLRSQICRLVSKTGTTLTFFPSIHADWSDASLVVKRFSVKSIDAGLEYLTVDGLASGAVIWGVQFNQCMDCWMQQVKIRNCANYNLHIWHSLNCEVFFNVIGPLDHGGSNGAGILHETSCQSLVINNIIFDSFPNFEWWGTGNMGNAIAYNMFDITAGAGILDHNAGDAYNLCEANVAPNIQDDGYFGVGYRQTAFRNYLFGIYQGYESGEAVSFAVSINRMNRYRGFVGNFFAANPSYGNPNIGNGNSIGVVAPAGAIATLTTRTNATTGTITGPSGHTVTTGATITVSWAEDTGVDTQLARIRRGVTVGSVSGNSIPISGGVGDDLPAALSSVYIPNTNPSLAQWWAQLNAGGSTITGSLTTRTNDTTGVFTVSGSGTITSDNWPTSFRWASGYRYQLTTGTVTGATVPLLGLNNPGGDVLPSVSTSGALFAGPNAYQELDLDCLTTAWSVGNWWATQAGIPPWETLNGDTLPDSLIFPSAPSWMSGYTYPFDPASGSPSADDIPAGDRYLNGVDPQDQLNVTTLNATTLTVG